MNNIEKNQLIYKLAYDYLLSILPNQINSEELQKYFISSLKKSWAFADKPAIDSSNCKMFYIFRTMREIKLKCRNSYFYQQ